MREVVPRVYTVRLCRKAITLMMRRWLDGSAILYWLLIGLVLFAYIAPVYVVITQSFFLHDVAPPWYVSLVAFVVVALTFKPVWRWIQPRVHHVVYAADDPTIDALGHMSDALAGTAPDSSMLVIIAETIAQIVRVPYVQVETLDGVNAVVGNCSHSSLRTRIEITYADTSLGWIEVASRLPREPLTTGEYTLLSRLTRQIGITLHAANLSAALQASREQIVTAREEERRRIRRDLHDGLGPTLAGLRMQLTALRRSVRDDPDAAEALIDSLRDDVRAATTDIRRLVYDLRPPLLDELGLLGALRHLASLLDGATFTLDAPARLPPLPAAVEVAVYRIAAEAVQNVAKHAGARTCAMSLVLRSNTLVLRVADTGAGLPVGNISGVGMVSMRERAAELGGQVAIESAPGGGTCVVATIPCKANL